MVGDSTCYLKTYELSNLYACKKNSLMQVKDQYKLSIFYVKLGKKISINVNHIVGKLPFGQFLLYICVLNVKMRPTLMMVRFVLAIFQINEIII